MDERTENIIEVTSEIEKFSFIDSTLYKTGKKFDIKKKDLT